MSALVGICARDAIHLLTDGASVYARDGVVASIGTKQFHCYRMVIATTGAMPPCVEFARLTDGASFDEIVASAGEIWSGVVATMPPAAVGTDYGLLLGGWSEARQGLELYSLESHEPADMAQLAAFATGPTAEAVEALATLGEAHDELAAGWGSEAPAKLGRAQARISSILQGMTPGDRQAASDWFDNLPEAAAAAVIRSLGEKGR